VASIVKPDRRRAARRIVVAALVPGALCLGWILLGVSDSGDVASATSTAVAAALPAVATPPDPRPLERAPQEPVSVAAPVRAPFREAARKEAPQYRDWSASVAVLPGELGGVGTSLKLGLDAARNNDMAFCFREPAGDAPDAGTEPRVRRSADLLLYLTARDSAVDVVDAQLLRAGDLPAEVVECCLEVLRGMEVKVFFAVPGQRYRYVFEIEDEF
jgi:hypothetical protein